MKIRHKKLPFEIHVSGGDITRPRPVSFIVPGNVPEKVLKELQEIAGESLQIRKTANGITLQVRPGKRRIPEYVSVLAQIAVRLFKQLQKGS